VTETTPSREALPPALVQAFAPLHKRAFGTAVGLACAVAVFCVTGIYLLRQPERGFADLALFGEYFYGYTVSWRGALVGAAWGFVAGFVAGWFFAFCRNLFLATWIFVTRERAALAATKDFLDHI
jgi:hypothetical protein